MKYALPLLLALVISQPAEAGVIHRIGRIVRAPIFVATLGVMTILDVTVTPVLEGIEHYTTTPCVKF